MSSDMLRDAKGRYAGANQSATEAEKRNQTPSTVLRAVDEEEEERPGGPSSNIPSTEPRGPELWGQQATPATTKLDKHTDQGPVAEQEQEQEHQSLQ